MRTTITLDDELLREAKRVAVSSGKTMSEVIEEFVREGMTRRKSAGQQKRVTLPTFKGNGVLPGVDLYNSAALYDLMDEVDANP